MEVIRGPEPRDNARNLTNESCDGMNSCMVVIGMNSQSQRRAGGFAQEENKNDDDEWDA